MNDFPKTYTIRIAGRLHDRWKDWFDGMTATNLENDQVLLEGVLQDQSVLVGIINQIHNLNLKLISVNCKQNSRDPETDASGSTTGSTAHCLNLD